MIKLLIMDVDGTLTDGKIYYSSSGEEIKAFNVKDGYAIKEILPQNDILPAIITGRISKCVQRRAIELNIDELYQGIDNKIEIFNKLKKKYKLKNEDIAFIGDDFNDLCFFEENILTACPNDATEVIKKKANIILTKSGGDGAVQEFILKILESF